MADMDNTPLSPAEQPFEAIPRPTGSCELSIMKVRVLCSLCQFPCSVQDPSLNYISFKRCRNAPDDTRSLHLCGGIPARH